jgi:hypothetical protein
MSDNPDRNMKNIKFCSQLSTYFKRHMGFRKADESLWLWGIRARGLSHCVEGSWTDWNHARKYPRLAWAGTRRPRISNINNNTTDILPASDICVAPSRVYLEGLCQCSRPLASLPQRDGHPCVGGRYGVVLCASYLRREVSEKLCLKIRFGPIPEWLALEQEVGTQGREGRRRIGWDCLLTFLTFRIRWRRIYCHVVACVPTLLMLHCLIQNILKLSRIWGSHSGGYEEHYFLGYNAV